MAQRDKEIERASIDWYYKDKKQVADVAEAFEAGAKWADRTLTKKACDWLKENAADYAFYQDGEECYNFEELIIDFKRAMR